MKFFKILIFVIVLFSFSGNEVLSQCTFPECDCGDTTCNINCCPPDPPPDPVPIPGIPILIGAGIIYGIIKARKRGLDAEKH